MKLEIAKEKCILFCRTIQNYILTYFSYLKRNYCIIKITNYKSNHFRGGDYVDFSDKIKQFSKRIEVIKENLTTEEATKTALIMPFSKY